MTDETPGTGHNSGYRVTAAELRSFVERYERLDAEKRELGDQQKEVKAEAKARGYDMKAFAEILRRRKKERKDVQELDALVELYEDALGIFG